MRIPLNWLKEYIDLPEKQEDLTHQLTMAGHMLDKVDHKNGHVVLDLELRGNRADCYSILGIAREASALFKTPVAYPKVHTPLKKVSQLKDAKLDVKTPLVKRVMMVAIKGVTITDSPNWLKEKLEEYGMPSINNIVDLTNFVMLETGEPMHAFDLDKVAPNLEIRPAKNKEKMVTFLGKELTLTNQDLVWAKKNAVLSVAAAIGSKHYSISNETKNILVEAASYDRANVRRSIHRHNILTDAGIRHEKELDPTLVEFGIYRFLELIKENGWGTVQSEIMDYYPNPIKPWKMSMNYDYLSSLSGLTIDKKEVRNILTSLNFKIVKDTDHELQVFVPTYRTDVTLEEDLIEEVLRIYGYDKIPTRTLSLEIPDDVTPAFIKQEEKVREALVGIGFDEVISLPFVLEKNLKLNKFGSGLSPIRITNRPSPDFEELRTNMFANLHEFTKKIINERGERALIFEIGKIYYKEGKKYHEKRQLGIMWWWRTNGNFSLFKGLIEAFFESMNINNVKFSSRNETGSVFELIIGKTPIGLGMIVHNIYYVDIYLDEILGKNKKPKANLWPKYPPQIEDITLIIPPRTKLGDLLDVIKNEVQIVEAQLVDIYENAYTFRLWYQDPEKTLTDGEVEEVRVRVLENLKKKYRVTLR